MYPNKRVKNIVSDINKVFKTYFKNDANLIWFGSWMRGNAYLQSDIDLAIAHKKPLDKKDLVDFWQYLDDFPTLYKIDLVNIDSADEVLKNEIFKNGKFL